MMKSMYRKSDKRTKKSRRNTTNRNVSSNKYKGRKNYFYKYKSNKFYKKLRGGSDYNNITPSQQYQQTTPSAWSYVQQVVGDTNSQFNNTFTGTQGGNILPLNPGVILRGGKRTRRKYKNNKKGGFIVPL